MENAVEKVLSAGARETLTCPERWALMGAPLTGATATSVRHRQWMKSRQFKNAYLNMMLVLEGDGVHGIEGQLFRFRPGTVLVFPPYIEHDKGLPPWARPMTRLSMSFPHDVTLNLYAYRNGMAAPHVRRSWFFPLSEIGLNRRLIDAAGEFTAQPHDTSLWLKVLAILSAVVSRLLDCSRSLQKPAEGAIQRQRIDAVRLHIEADGGRDIHLQKLAQAFDISPFHLLRSFKRQMGCTVHHFADRCRLHTMHMLLMNGVPHKAIARELGFSSLTTFSRWERNMRRHVRPDVRPTAIEGVSLELP